MLFDSYPFALFIAAVWTVYWLLSGTKHARIWWLLAASYFFYGWWDPRFLALIAASTLLDFVVGQALHGAQDQRRRRMLVGISLAGNLGALGFFKYWGFFTREAARMIESLGFEAHLPTLQVILPVGISFYTFQTLSYTLDIYRRQLEPERDFGRFALFVAFFPQLVAGPIVRARDFLPQMRTRPVLTAPAFESGLALFFWGLVKKVVIADYLGGTLVDDFWNDPTSYGGLASVLGIWAYALQIYGDFSGYSDCAIGLARMLGFELCENFDKPYCATSPRDFWRRWHISLSTWLRDYLYISLGGNRGGPWFTYRNLALTMLLGGLWHGASWMFVIWGAYQGLLLIVDRLVDLPEPKTGAGVWLRRAVMFQLVCLGWVFFRSATPSDAWAVLGSLFAPQGSSVIEPWVLVAMGFGFATHLAPRATVEALRSSFLGLPGLVKGAIYALVLGLILNASGLDRPFIYFQF
ncbi:MBOAT family O-acyltransferase [Engelhardtia mirabilis]|uniref:Peptidoglycan O-acetyltransferase n=1 Tax=Engelhardtia mirabilis TaxID=2528011 RepID=A0A518BGD0_9BACT|nr:Peptidoglycan O-acetyltransferase [Planctomycetes bacterium Pla133]QDV00359.1 Peptidoglycan O-acetyltransferase [Planctomycetes bacterium Pla86]